MFASFWFLDEVLGELPLVPVPEASGHVLELADAKEIHSPLHHGDIQSDSISHRYTAMEETE